MNPIDEAKIDILKNEVPLSDRWQYGICDGHPENEQHPNAFRLASFTDGREIKIQVIRFYDGYLLVIRSTSQDDIFNVLHEWKDGSVPNESEIDNYVNSWLNSWGLALNHEN